MRTSFIALLASMCQNGSTPVPNPGDTDVCPEVFVDVAYMGPTSAGVVPGNDVTLLRVCVSPTEDVEVKDLVVDLVTSEDSLIGITDAKIIESVTGRTQMGPLEFIGDPGSEYSYSFPDDFVLFGGQETCLEFTVDIGSAVPWDSALTAIMVMGELELEDLCSGDAVDNVFPSGDIVGHTQVIGAQ